MSISTIPPRKHELFRDRWILCGVGWMDDGRLRMTEIFWPGLEHDDDEADDDVMLLAGCDVNVVLFVSSFYHRHSFRLVSSSIWTIELMLI
jgi:hypothetical protein